MNVGDDYKQKLEELMNHKARVLLNSTLDHNDSTCYIFVNESDLYELIFGSKNNEAHIFKIWV